MAIWEMRAVDQYGDRFWENIWHVDVGDDGDIAPGLVEAFATFHQACLLDLYTLARTVRRPAGTADAFIEVVIGAAGGIDSGTGLALPLFNVIRVLLNGGAGRPGVKLLRGILLASDVIDAANHINPDVITFVNTHLDDLLNAASVAGQQIVFGSANQPAVSAEPSNLIAMRQLHRKRKKTIV
jgi:hypothetical protein